MIKRIQQYLTSVDSVFIDGCIYVLLAFTTTNAVCLSSDMAAKYIDAFWLFLSQWGNNAIGAMLLALKMYRSTSFADHQEAKKRSGDTAFFTKPTEPNQ